MSEEQYAANLVRNVVVRFAYLEDLPSFEWDGEYRHYRRLYRDIYAGVERGEAAMWVAELSPVGIIGQLFVQFHSGRQELADGKQRAYIYGFRIRPAYRGRGLGTHMLAIVEADLVKRGFELAVLNVGRDNPAALALYQRQGYSVVAGEPGVWSYVDDQGVHRRVDEPAWRMEKVLKRDLSG